MTLNSWKLYVKHSVLMVEKIVYKFIVANDFLTQYLYDLLNSAKAIVFDNKHVPYTLFKSILN